MEGHKATRGIFVTFFDYNFCHVLRNGEGAFTPSCPTVGTSLAAGLAEQLVEKGSDCGFEPRTSRFMGSDRIIALG